MESREWNITSSNYKNGFYHITEKDVTSKTPRRMLVVELKYGSHPIKDYLDRAEYNAQLISSAPELLSALQLFIDPLTGLVLDSVANIIGTEQSSQIERAIKKAVH